MTKTIKLQKSAASTAKAEPVILQSHIFAAFDQGQIPTISCINAAPRDLPQARFLQIVNALQKFVDLYFAPVWATKCVLQATTKIAPKTWGLVFLPSADVPNAFGYHDLTRDNLPLSKIFLDVSKRAGEDPAITASHELAEMLVDPGIQLLAMDARGTIYAYETADADEASHFLVDNIPMTNFVYPSWFEGFRAPRSTRFDYMGHIDRPFKIMPGGYMSIFRNGQWKNIFSSKASEKRFNLSSHSRAAIRLTQRQIANVDVPITPRKKTTPKKKRS